LSMDAPLTNSKFANAIVRVPYFIAVV